MESTVVKSLLIAAEVVGNRAAEKDELPSHVAEYASAAKRLARAAVYASKAGSVHIATRVAH